MTRLSVFTVLAMLACQGTALAQSLEIKRYNYAEWAKGRFSEVVTVNGPGKTIYVAGVGAEDEDKPWGAIRYPGDFLQQCRYAYDKIRRHLAAQGAGFGDVVKQVTYVTDIRFLPDFGKCRTEAWGNGPIPTNTFINVLALAVPGMLVEIDVTAVVAK
jgi:enamine deaminase RidA (YjgF/YER057c/UK114 family)